MPSTECPLVNETWQLLSATIGPLSISDVHGVDIYLRDYKFLFPFEVTLTPCPKMLESFLKM